MKDLGAYHLDVHLRPDRLQAFVLPPDDTRNTGKCRRPAPNVRATFNAAPLERFTGEYALGDLAYDRDCIIELGFPGHVLRSAWGTGARTPAGTGVLVAGPIPERLKRGEDASLVLDDGSARWSFEIPKAFTPRRLELVAPADGRVKRGDTVTLQWSMPSDDLSDAAIGVAVYKEGQSRDAVTVPASGVRVEGTRIAVTLPNDLPEALDGPVEVWLTNPWQVRPKVGACPVSRCSTKVEFQVEPARVTLGR